MHASSVVHASTAGQSLPLKRVQSQVVELSLGQPTVAGTAPGSTSRIRVNANPLSDCRESDAKAATVPTVVNVTHHGDNLQSGRVADVAGSHSR